MAPRGEEEATPGVTAAPTLTVEALVTALRELQGTSQAPPRDRYSLSPPIFGGEGDVEQFIREFQDVHRIVKGILTKNIIDFSQKDVFRQWEQ